LQESFLFVQVDHLMQICGDIQPILAVREADRFKEPQNSAALALARLNVGSAETFRRLSKCRQGNVITLPSAV